MREKQSRLLLPAAGLITHGAVHEQKQSYTVSHKPHGAYQHDVMSTHHQKRRPRSVNFFVIDVAELLLLVLQHCYINSLLFRLSCVQINNKLPHT